MGYLDFYGRLIKTDTSIDGRLDVVELEKGIYILVVNLGEQQLKEVIFK